jgi:hypothetical protein
MIEPLKFENMPPPAQKVKFGFATPEEVKGKRFLRPTPPKGPKPGT